MLGGGGNPSAWFDLGDRRVGFDSTGELHDATAIGCGNDAVGVSVAASVSPAADIWWASIDTVSLSEDGFERTHQGSSLAFVWPLQLAARRVGRVAGHHGGHDDRRPGRRRGPLSAAASAAAACQPVRYAAVLTRRLSGHLAHRSRPMPAPSDVMVLPVAGRCGQRASPGATGPYGSSSL